MRHRMPHLATVELDLKRASGQVEAGMLEDVLLQLCCPASPGGTPLRRLTCTRCPDAVSVDECV